MVVIFGPPPTISNFTVAVVLMRFAGLPAFSRLAESAIEKQPASAAAMSSSGLVPFPSSKRDEKEYGPSNAPLPSFIVPLPCFRVPSHTADPVRVAIAFPPLVFRVRQAIVPAILRQTALSASLQLAEMRTSAIRFCERLTTKPFQ